MHQFESEKRWLPWFVVAVLFFAAVINYVDRVALSITWPQMRTQFHLSSFDYGLALNAFFVFYTLSYIFMGRLLDHIGPRRSLILGLIAWSIVSMAHSWTTGLISLCLFRLLLGVTQGGFFPTATRAISDWLKPKDRGGAIGTYLSGVSVGTLITPPLITFLMLRYGWRASFLVSGAAGFVLLPAWLWIHSRAKTIYGTVDPSPGWQEGETRSAGSLRAALKDPAVWKLVVARGITDAVWYFYIFWLPEYFVRERHFTSQMVGQYLWIPFLAADITGVLGGWLSSLLVRRGVDPVRARGMVMIPSALLLPLGTVANWAGSWSMALVLFSVALSAHLAWGTNMHTLVTDVVPPLHLGVIFGLTGAAGSLGGAIFQLLAGTLVDRFSFAPVLVLAGFLHIIAAVLLFRRRLIPVLAQKE